MNKLSLEVYRDKIFSIENVWLEEAIETAQKRRDYHANLGSKNHWYDPDKGQYADEIFGSLGQIVFREKIKDLGLEKNSKFAPLYTNDLSELPKWDAEVCGKSIEIKTIPPDTNVKRIRLLVKVSEFKNLDYYVAIKFWDSKTYSFCGFATGSEIAKAQIRDFGYAPAYWLYIKELPHDLKDLYLGE